MVAQSRHHPSGHVRSTQVAYLSGVEAPTLLQSCEISHSLTRSCMPSRDPVRPHETSYYCPEIPSIVNLSI